MGPEKKSAPENKTVSLETLQRLMSLFRSDEPLPAQDKRYVDFGAERGSAGLVEVMASGIRLISNRTCQLLSGHRGCGKTTELNLLKHNLEQTAPHYFVVYCEADKYLDENDVDYPDVLLVLTQQLMTDFHKAGIKVKPGPLRRFWEDLKDLLSSVVTLSKVKPKTPFLDFDFDIKKNPDNRQKVREHLRPRATPFLDAINEVIQSAQQALPKEKYAGLVVIMDNLDRVFRNPPVQGSGRTNLEALFIDGSDYLSGVACHVVYTIPPALRYSPAGAKLGALYGSSPQVMPMIPVTRRNGDPDDQGMQRLREAVEKRFAEAGVPVDEAFGPTALKRVCAASGGYVRSLLLLVQTALRYEGRWPISAAKVEQAIHAGRNTMIDAISPKPKQWQTLREVFKTKAPVEAEEYLALLDNLIVLEYRDADGPWHDVHPLAQEARQFRVPAP